jgi:hypothetical protein
VRVDQGYRGGSPEVARLLAWIDAVAAYADHAGVVTAFESADLRETARAAGHYTEAARLLAESADPELRAAFARADCLEVILGSWDVDLGWHEGMSKLTYMECIATTLSLNGLQPWEIANHEDMLSKRRRRVGETVPVENVYKYLSVSAGKLAGLFGQRTAAETLVQPESPEATEEVPWDEALERFAFGDMEPDEEA